MGQIHLTGFGEFPGGSSSSGSGGGGGPGTPGSITLRQFPFAFDTPDLASGASLYTPTIGDILIDAWIEIDTAWDGTTPLGDIGSFDGTSGGMFANALGPVNMIHVDAAGGGLSLDPDQLAQGSSTTGTDISQTAIGASITATPVTKIQRSIPAKFTTDNPIKVVVSQDGTSNMAEATFVGSNPATVPLTVTHNVNDQLVFTGSAGGVGGAKPPETFTVAPGTYANLSALSTAINNSTGSVSGEPFSTYVIANAFSPPALAFQMVGDDGAGDNGNTISAGTHDITAALGIDNPSTFAGGSGGAPGATQGAAILYLLTATPL